MMDLKEQKRRAIKAYQQALREGDYDTARSHMREALRLHGLIYPDWRDSYNA